MPIESVMPSSHLILFRPLLLLPPIPPSITVFPNESTLLMRWPKYWSFNFSISPSNEHPGLISFRMTGWISLQSKGLSKSLLQHHSSNTSIFRRSAFFTVQLSHPYMTTGKTIALTRRTFVVVPLGDIKYMKGRFNLYFQGIGHIKEQLEQMQLKIRMLFCVSFDFSYCDASFHLSYNYVQRSPF